MKKRLRIELQENSHFNFGKFKVFYGDDLVGFITKEKNAKGWYYSAFLGKGKYDSEHVICTSLFVQARMELIKSFCQINPVEESKPTNITALPEGNAKNFYPTPSYLAGKMLSLIEWNRLKNVLEPSAGKGDLVKYLLKSIENLSCFCKSEVDVDCIEIDKHLQHILKGENYRLVYDDFLTFETYKSYDLIVMNPPFDKGADHLLKAISLQEKNGGQICCLLNAETLKNPCSIKREHLAELLKKYTAKIQYHSSMFKNSQRKSNVEIAIVYIKIPKKNQMNSEFFSRMEYAEELKKNNYDVPKELAISNLLEGLISRYNIETKASLQLINEYEAMKPYILRSAKKQAYGNYPILQLTVGDKDLDVNTYLKAVRYKYWQYLLSHASFTGKLTENLRRKYMDMLDDMQNYEFNMFNIEKILVNINAEMIQGVKDTVLNLFEQMTVEHTWYQECIKNKHYFNGWKTNKAHKVGKKVIIPTNLFSSWSFEKNKIDNHAAICFISDLEKSLRFLDRTELYVDATSENNSISRIIDAACKSGQTKNIEFKYFHATFYKKGTVHIKFKDESLIDMLNIFACQQKEWLPPSYGYKKYEDMETEEQNTIDSFQGKKAYEKVMENPGNYLFNPIRNFSFSLPETHMTA